MVMLAALAAGEVTANAQSDLYIVNFFGNKITRHNPSTGALVSTLNVTEPTGAEIGPDGNLYTVGYDGAIRRFNPNTGALLATLATNVATFPDDLHFGPDGNMYAACEFGLGILRYDINGNPRPSAGNTGAVFFFGPNRFISTTFSKDGSLYVTDYGSEKVWKKSSAGVLQGAFVSTNLFSPIDLKFGPDGNLWVCNRDTNDVRRFDGTTGAFLGIFASGNSLNKTDSFDFGPDGNLYVAGRINNAVFRFNGSTGAFIDTFINSDLSDPSRVRFFGTSTMSVSGITPDTVVVNSAAFQMTINGTGLAPFPTVRFNSTVVNVRSAVASRVSIDVPAALLTSKRTFNLTVAVAGKISNAVPFRVTDVNLKAPPNLIIGPIYRTGLDPVSGNRYAVLLLTNQGSGDITNINLSQVRLYFDPNFPTQYLTPINVQLESGASPAGTLIDTPPGYRLEVRFDFSTTPSGPVQLGVISVVGTSNQGAFNAGSLFLKFP